MSKVKTIHKYQIKTISRDSLWVNEHIILKKHSMNLQASTRPDRCKIWLPFIINHPSAFNSEKTVYEVHKTTNVS